MNETIKFSYVLRNAVGMVHKVFNVKTGCGVTADELCDMFVDFMRSAGYAEENIEEYFKKYIEANT